MSTNSKIIPRIQQIFTNTDLKAVALNGILIAAWIWLYRAVFPYLQIIFTQEEFRTNQIVLVGALFLIYRQAHKGAIHFRFQSRPQLYLPALILAFGSSIGYLLIERYLDINTFSATLFGLASYGLLGLWMRPQWWRAGLPAAGSDAPNSPGKLPISWPARLLLRDLSRRLGAWVAVELLADPRATG